MNVLLQRNETSDEGTFGRLFFRDHVFYTGELPWRDLDGNKVGDDNLSCINPGIYECVYTYSKSFSKNMYHVLDVPGRTGIRIHSANHVGDVMKGYKSHLKGCIALGKSIGVIDGQKAIQSSRLAISEFEQALQYKPFTLEIIESPNLINRRE